MGDAFKFVGSAGKMATSFATGALSNVNAIFLVVDVVDKFVQACTSAYGLYSEKQNTRQMKMQYEYEIKALDIKIIEERKRTEIIIQQSQREMVMNLEKLGNELQLAKCEFQREIDLRIKEFSIDIEKEMLQSANFKKFLKLLEVTIENCNLLLQEKADYMDSCIEEEFRDVVMKYAGIVKNMI